MKPLDNCIDQQTHLGFEPLMQRYLKSWLVEKTDAYSSNLYDPHAGLVGTYLLCAMFHERHPTMSYEYREHYSQYIIFQTFTA